MNINLLRDSLTGLTSLLNLVIGRGRITLNTKEDGPIQILQAKISARETPDLKRMAEFGFTSRPPPGSDCIVVFRGGQRTEGVIIATGHQTYRLQLENDGEVALYDSMGRYVWFKKDGGLTLHDPTQITLDSPLTVCTGDFHADGNVKDSVRTMADDRGKYDIHTHGGGTIGSGTTTGPTPTE